MTVEDALRSYHAARIAVIAELRRPLVDAVARREDDLKKQQHFPKPNGFLRVFFRDDYVRLRSDLLQAACELDAARRRLSDFEYEATDTQSPAQRQINAEALKRCDRLNPRILQTIRTDKEQKAEMQRVNAFIEELSRETGTRHKLVWPSHAPGLPKKRESTLVGSIELGGRLFAKTTDDKGYSFELFPWLPEMEQYVGRACWYWYSEQGKFRFAPLVATRPPISAASIQASSASEQTPQLAPRPSL